MSEIVSSKNYLINTDIGMIRVSLETIDNYDIEDLVHDRAMAQAKIIKFLAQGRNVDVNKEINNVAIRSTFYSNKEELPS